MRHAASPNLFGNLHPTIYISLHQKPDLGRDVRIRTEIAPTTNYKPRTMMMMRGTSKSKRQGGGIGGETCRSSNAVPCAWDGRKGTSYVSLSRYMRRSASYRMVRGYGSARVRPTVDSRVCLNMKGLSLGLSLDPNHRGLIIYELLPAKTKSGRCIGEDWTAV